MVAALAGLAMVVAGCTGTGGGQVEVRSATTERPPSTTTTAPPDCADMLPPEARAVQLVMAMVPAPTSATEELAAGLLGGIALEGNQRSDVAAQIREATADVPLPVIVAADEEGGGVQRLRLAAGSIPSAADLAEGTPEEAADVVGQHAATVRELGVTMMLAPVADVGSGSGLGTRSFGRDPLEVSAFVEALVPAIRDAGVVPVVKHWPGIGAGGPDPHQRLPTLAEVETLRTRDLVPFDRAIAVGAPAIMVTHAAVPGLTAPGEPASLSRNAITGELRGRQGFDGLVLTDDLSMAAVTNLTTEPEAAELAIAAGADVALVGDLDVAERTRARLVDAITTGRLPEGQVVDSVRRVLRVKGVSGPCLDAVSRYSALLRSAAAPDTSTGGATTGPTVSIVQTGPPTTRAPGGSQSATGG